MTLLIIIAGIIIALVAIYVLLGYIIAGTIIHLNRQPVPRNPGDYSMNFENVEFKTEDGVLIKGWLVPGSLNKLVVMTHVGGLTKYGSTVSYKNPTKLYNKEIEFPKTFQHLHAQGYWVLTFDFRNHGESGPDSDHGNAAVGLREYRDVVAAMDYINSRNDLKDMDTGFVGFCTGANSIIIAMGKVPDKFKSAKCLFAVQPISMEVFIRTYLKRLVMLPGSKLLMLIIKKWVLWRGSIPLEEMSPKKYVKDLKVPTKYIQARNDPWTELSDIQGFYNNTPDNPREFFWIENTKHRFESYSYFQEKPEIMLEWLKKWL
jgi:uncharacterized protein